MNIRFRCMNCGRALSAPPKAAGRKLKCPSCRLEVTVPPASSAVAGSTATSASPANQVTPIDEEELPADHALLLFPPRDEGHGDLIDMTAMVDIVFFLLIFFLVTSMQSLESVINFPSVQDSSGASATSAPTDYLNDPTYVVVTIDEEDTVWLEEEQIYSDQNLRSKLRAIRKDSPETTGLVVIGDPDATHGTLVGVLDAGADAGIKELLFSVSQDADDESG
jgi:biopolymer transport protein ExbD